MLLRGANNGWYFQLKVDSNVVLKTNGKGMPYLDLREFKAKAVMSFASKAALSSMQTV